METSRSQIVEVTYTLALEVPENVLVEILLKLPVKSLLRFLCVSQEWYALTKSSYFIARHLVHRSSCTDRSRPSLLFFSSRARSSEDDCRPQLEFSLLRDGEITFLGLPFLSNLAGQKPAIKLVESSNGLVFCHVLIIENESRTSTTEEIDIASTYRELLIVWNPATQQFRCLPQPESNKPSGQKEEEPISSLFGFDFVHDHDISEYKLVRIFSHGSDDPEGHGREVTTFEAQVFIKSTNSWRQVKDKLEFQSCKSWSQPSAKMINGVLYWKVVQKSDECFVLSFSLREEVFSMIQLPLDLRYLDSYVYNWTRAPIYSWNDSPAIPVIDYSETGNPNNVVFWVMNTNEIAERKSNENGTQMKTPAWVQQVRFKYSVFDGLSMIGIWKDQFLFISRIRDEADADADAGFVIEPEDLLLHDPRSETMRTIVCRAERIMFLQVANYVETLVPV